MTSTSLRLPLALAFLALTSLPSKAGDWPQWRGPDRSDRSSEKNLLKKWPQEGPKKLWVFEKAGLGYSGFSTADGRLFTMGARDGKEVVIAIDAAKGTELWASPAGDVYSNHWGDGPRSTPTIESGKVYALGAQGNIVCLEAATGKEVWRASMTGMGGKVPGWGYCESLLVENGSVYCTPGGAQGAIAALDQNTGKVKWRTKDFTDEAHYSSIVPVDHNGARQLIQLSPKNVVGIDGRTGATLWTSPWPGRTAVIPTPIFKDGHVYITSGYGVGCKLVKVGEANSVTQVYENKVMKNHHGGVVLVGNHLYGNSDGPGWICQDFMTGTEVWASKSLGKGCVSYADGMLYCVEEGSGTVALASASAEGWKESGRFKLAPQSTQRKPDGRIWTHPVISHGRLYLRDQEFVYCFDVKSGN